MKAYVRLRACVAGVACLALAACDYAGFGPRAAPPPSLDIPTVPTPKSAAAMAYYAQVQATLLREGLLRSDPGSEIPVTPEILAQNFLKVALFDEYRRDVLGAMVGDLAQQVVGQFGAGFRLSWRVSVLGQPGMAQQC